MPKNDVTGAEAGLAGNDQILIALQTIEQLGGIAEISDIYAAIEEKMDGPSLSDQGKASLRRLVNSNAVQAGYLYTHDPENPGWRITPEGREYLSSDLSEQEEIINVDTGQTENVQAHSVRGAAFERSTLILLRNMYPRYAWYHQGQHKQHERGIDLIGRPLGESGHDYGSIGVQVKLHSPTSAPSAREWLKFLAGAFVRRIGTEVFITTGRLSGEQRREAGEAGVIVIEGDESILELCATYEVNPEIFEDLFQMTEAG